MTMIHTKPTTSSGNAPKGKTMKSRLFKTVLSAACALAPLAAVPSASGVTHHILWRRDG